MEVASMMSENF